FGERDALYTSSGAFITPLDPNWPEPKRPMQARFHNTSGTAEPGRPIPIHDRSPNIAANSLESAYEPFRCSSSSARLNIASMSRAQPPEPDQGIAGRVLPRLRESTAKRDSSLSAVLCLRAKGGPADFSSDCPATARSLQASVRA